jgi:hypothetical protein
MLQTEFHIQGTKIVSKTEEPFFVLNIQIPEYENNYDELTI